MTDASYLTPSHLDVWRLHSLNGLGKENNSHPLVSANHYKMCCFYVNEREPISICSVLNVCFVLTEGNEI